MSSNGVIPAARDAYVNNVLRKYVKRSDVGLEKYGTTLERNDLSEEDWLIHLQEELMDASLYIERLLSVVRERVSNQELVSDEFTEQSEKTNVRE